MVRGEFNHLANFWMNKIMAIRGGPFPSSANKRRSFTREGGSNGAETLDDSRVIRIWQSKAGENGL